MIATTLLLALLGAAPSQSSWSHLAPKALLAAPPCDKTGESEYETDISHMLKELGQRAAAPLKVKDIDWKKVTKKYQALAKDVETDEQLVDLAFQLTAELRDGHARVNFDAKKIDMSIFADGPRSPCGLNLYPKDGKWYVLRAVGAADKSGVKAGWQVVKIDGMKVADWMAEAKARMTKRDGFSTEHAADWIVGTWGMTGPDGTSSSFEFRDTKKKKKKKTLDWYKKAGGSRLYGPVVYPKDLEKAGDRVYYQKLGSGMGYVLIDKIPGDLPDSLDKALAALGEVDGLIIDFRANMGGGYDRDELLGRFIPKGQTFGNEKSTGPKPYTGQMVLLADPSTISAAETIVGELKEEGRAYLIGPGPTHGASGQKETVEAPSGKFSIYFVVRSNKQRFNGGRGVEGIGIAPDEVVAYDPKVIASGMDPCIARAEELLKSPLPKKAVSYVPPK